MMGLDPDITLNALRKKKITFNFPSLKFIKDIKNNKIKDIFIIILFKIQRVLPTVFKILIEKI